MAIGEILQKRWSVPVFLQPSCEHRDQLEPCVALETSFGDDPMGLRSEHLVLLWRDLVMFQQLYPPFPVTHHCACGAEMFAAWRN
jgi:hypothetical protein